MKKGDRVVIYMPLTIEGAIAMLACARIGAIHSVVYAGLGHTALRDRIVDAEAKVVIVGDGFRRGKTVELKAIVDEAIDALELVEKVVVFSRRPVELASKREVNFNDLLKFPTYRQIAVAAAGQPPSITLSDASVQARRCAHLQVIPALVDTVMLLSLLRD